jgi:hypothetical protein
MPKKSSAKKKSPAKKKPSAKKGAPKPGAAKIVAGGNGCCTIQYDDKPEDEIPGITQAACNQIARQRGGTAQWTPGACAE